MNNLSVKNLSKKYPEFELKNISFDIPKGTIVGFVGENGAGKTTTIKAILDLIQIDSGQIEIFGKDYKERHVKEKVGVVLEDSFFSEELTVKDVDSILKNIEKDWDSKLYYKYMKDFNLSSNKKIKELSKGMQMKLKIAVALSNHPNLLILDEATSGLDPIARAEILDIFQDFIQEDNHSIFVSSHITSDLEQIADSIIFISNGEIILNKSHDELLKSFGIGKCTKEEFSKIDKKDYIAYRKKKFEYEILVEDKSKFQKKYKLKDMEKANIEEIMLLMIKGDKK